MTADGRAQAMTLAATSRTTVRVNDIDGLEAAAFSTTVALERQRAAGRRADDVVGRGGLRRIHGKGQVRRGRDDVVFRGRVAGLLPHVLPAVQPASRATVAHVTYLMEGGPADAARLSGGRDDAADGRSAAAMPELVQPIVRRAGDVRSAGAWRNARCTSATRRSTTAAPRPRASRRRPRAGILAEGATGTFFDTFVLIANPNSDDRPR